MNSRVLGAVPLDRGRLGPELAAMLRFPLREAYSEYIFGRWRSAALWNGTGAHEDGLLAEYDGEGAPTELLAELPYVRSIVERSFDLRHLRWLRIFVLDRGVILPHRDFLGFEGGFTRLHLPLATDQGCLHSEAWDVFHMRAGEIWSLDATTVHAACNLRGAPRISLCFDFASGPPPADLVRAAGAPAPAALIRRPPLDTLDRSELRALGALLTESTFRVVAGRLATIHFERRVHAGAMFAWLSEAARAAGSQVLEAQACELAALALGEAGTDPSWAEEA